MKITLNNKPVNISDTGVTIAELIEMQKIPSAGTAIALNDRLIVRSKWKDTVLNDNDTVVVISAAFGG